MPALFDARPFLLPTPLPEDDVPRQRHSLPADYDSAAARC